MNGAAREVLCVTITLIFFSVREFISILIQLQQRPRLPKQQNSMRSISSNFLIVFMKRYEFNLVFSSTSFQIGLRFPCHTQRIVRYILRETYTEEEHSHMIKKVILVITHLEDCFVSFSSAPLAKSVKRNAVLLGHPHPCI